MDKHSVEFVIGLILGAAGCWSIIQQRFSLGIGRGRPLFYLRLTGRRAVVFGVGSLIGALVALFPFFYVVLVDDVTVKENQFWGVYAFVGLVICGFVFAFSYFLEILDKIEKKHRL